MPTTLSLASVGYSSLRGIILVLFCCETWAGNPEGLAAVARCDYPTACREFSDAASRGDSNALLNLGLISDNCGEPQLGDERICKAAKANNAAAKFLVTLAAAWAAPIRGCEEKSLRNNLEELKQFEQLAMAAAETGDPLAMSLAGRSFERSSNPPDLFHAYVWYEMAFRRTHDRDTGLRLNEKDHARMDRDRVASKLNAQELERSTRLAEEMDRKIPPSRVLQGPPSCQRDMPNVPRK